MPTRRVGPLAVRVAHLHAVAAHAAVAGVRAVRRVELTNVTPVAAMPPILMVAPETKPVPVTVISVPPVGGAAERRHRRRGRARRRGGGGGGGGGRRRERGRARVGEAARRVGGLAVRVAHLHAVAARGLGRRRRAVSSVELTKVTPVAAVPPISMAAPETKPVPDTVIVVPPEVGPLSGDTDVAVRAGRRRRRVGERADAHGRLRRSGW